MSINDGKIFVNDGETMELFCPDRFKSPYDNHNVIILRCINGKLTFEENETDLECFSCNTKIESSVQSTQVSCTNSGATIYKNGFNTHWGFIELMTHCHDPNTKVTHWVDYYLTPENKICQSSTKDRFFPANYIEGEHIFFFSEISTANAYKNKILQDKTLKDCMQISDKL